MSVASRNALHRAPAGPNANGVVTRRVQPRLPAVRAISSSADADCSSRPAAGAPAPAAHTRRSLLGLAAAAAAAALAAAPPARADAVAAVADAAADLAPPTKQPYLLSTGARGLLAEEEAQLIALRRELEGKVRRELEAERQLLEAEARSSSIGKLCATPFGIDIVGITEFVALVGALVGGIAARQRKAELERLNEQLRKVNMGLRQQARAGMVYAPGLTYVPPAANGAATAAAVLAPPPPGPAAAAAAAAAPAAVAAAVVAPPRPATAAPKAAVAAPEQRTLLSMEDDEMSPDQIQCRDSLRSGKRLLKEKNGAAAMVRFEKALMLSKALDDKVQERRAMRGLAASARLQGQFKAAIKHLERVLEISREMKEFTGDADAYGTIADCYTEMGDFENAALNYDKYIRVMNTDGPV